MAAERIAVVTGASKGLGFAIVRRLCQCFDGKVYLTSASITRGTKAVKRLNRYRNCFPNFHPLKINNAHSCRLFGEQLREKHGGLDVLINNAAWKYRLNTTDLYHPANSMVKTNIYGTLLLSQLLFPLMRPHARVVYVSSPCGQLTDVPAGHLRDMLAREPLTIARLRDFAEAYRRHAREMPMTAAAIDEIFCATKAAASATTFVHQRMLHAMRPDDDIVLNSYEPGDLRSPVTHFTGHKSWTTAAYEVVHLATLPPYVTRPVGDLVTRRFRIVNWRGGPNSSVVPAHHLRDEWHRARNATPSTSDTPTYTHSRRNESTAHLCVGPQPAGPSSN